MRIFRVSMMLMIGACGWLDASPPPPGTVPATTSSESKPVEQGGVAVTVVLKPEVIGEEEQPRIVVRFGNSTTDYINLYDVEAFWDWRIRFTNVDAAATNPGPWQLRMNAIPHRYPIASRQIKAGEKLEVLIDLNDPPFTFAYAYAGSMNRTVQPVRHLAPGTYRVSLEVSLRNPLGQPGYHFWTGPVTTEPVDLKIRPRQLVGVDAGPNVDEVAAYDALIDRVTSKLDPHGLWLNGVAPDIKLPRVATPEDVVDAAVNTHVLGSKRYRVFRVRRIERLDQSVSAVLLSVGGKTKVLLFFPGGNVSWWTRFYDVEAATPDSQPARN